MVIIINQVSIEIKSKDMFKKSTTNQQLGLFTTASSLMCKRESKQYEDEKEWHMQFYRNVTCNIDEDVFRLKCYFL